MTHSDSWTPLDIDAEDPAIPVRPGPGQHVVGILAAAQARERGWARRAAIEICRGWAQDGSRILLCDLAFEEPELHEVAGLYNQEGISDALLFGCSLRRLGQPLADGFLLATAGTAVPDPEALRRHTRWQDLAEGFGEAGAVLALYLPADAPGAEALYELCDTVVVLGERPEVDAMELSTALGPLAVFGPHPEAGAYETSLAGMGSGDVLESLAGREMADDDALTSAGDVLGSDGGSSVQTTEGDGGRVPDGVEPHATTMSALDAPFPAEAPEGGEPGLRDLPETPAPMAPVQEAELTDEELAATVPGDADPPRGRTLLWGGAAVVALILILGLSGILPFPGQGPRATEDPVPTPAASTGGPETPEDAPETVAESAPVPEAPLAAYMLGLASYEELDGAWEGAVAFASVYPDVQFIVAPVEIDGVVWYRLLAGPGEEPEELLALRDRMAARGSRGAQNWLVREAGLAYLIDEPARLSDAEARVALLAEQGIPAHVLRHPSAQGPDRFRVYAGAFADSAEAAYLGRVLRDAAPGLRDAPLVERRGYRPE